jgi:hypothetical protein
MIHTLTTQFKNVNVDIEVEYTGPENIHYTIEDNIFCKLPVNSLEEQFLTLSLPGDFEKLCLVENMYTVKSVTPSTITFDDGKTCDIELFSLRKHLTVVNDELQAVDIPMESIEQALSRLEQFKIFTTETLAATSDTTRQTQLQTLLTEINFVIDSMKEDENFPYMLYKFTVV